MTPKQFARLLARDKYCLHCGTSETLVPNHRANRGMGGASKDSYLNKPSNLVVLCSMVNGLIESDDRWHALALENGWKISKWANPPAVPVYDAFSGLWFRLNDNYGYDVVV